MRGTVMEVDRKFLEQLRLTLKPEFESLQHKFQEGLDSVRSEFQEGLDSVCADIRVGSRLLGYCLDKIDEFEERLNRLEYEGYRNGRE